MPTDEDYIKQRSKILMEQLESLELMRGGVISVPPERIEEDKAKFRECFDEIMEILRFYCDIQEEYYSIITLWVMGTYLHEEFQTFPLLFINATKGSGKSRLLKLISALSYNGKIVLDLREAVLFRTAKDHTICIDEFERIGSKESGTMRTMINASYKKGTAVERMKKVTKHGQEEQVVERFDLYTPVVMANIWGMDDVVADRCIPIILEKSNNLAIINLIEDFDSNPYILNIKRTLEAVKCSLCMYLAQKNIINSWNTYISHTLIHYIHNIHINTLTTPQDLNELSLFNKIKATNIDGRNLELFFPLIIIADVMGEENSDKILEIIKKLVHEKKEEEYAESRDVSIIDFVSKKDAWRGTFQSVYEITKEFRMIANEDPDQEKWLNPHWLGRALKRSKLIIQKRRVSKGVEVMLDIDKAKTLLLRFKEVTPKSI